MDRRPWYARYTEPDPEPVGVVAFDFQGALDMILNDVPGPPDPYDPTPADAVLCLWAADEPLAGKLAGNGWLSAQHAASSLGQPVLILWDGTPVGPAEVRYVAPGLPPAQWKYIESAAENAARIAAHPTVVAAIMAGYPITIHGSVGE